MDNAIAFGLAELALNWIKAHGLTLPPDLKALVNALAEVAPPVEEPQEPETPPVEPAPEPAPLAPFGTNGNTLLKDGQPFKFTGCNLLELAWYGHPVVPHAKAHHIGQQLDVAKAFGMKVVRLFCAHKSTLARVAIPRVRAVLDALQARGMYALLVLADGNQTDFYPDDLLINRSRDPNRYTSYWITDGYRGNYKGYVNDFTKALGDHPAIFAWEPVNLYRPQGGLAEMPAVESFFDDISETIRENSPQKLIAAGWGWQILDDFGYATGSAKRIYQHPRIDLATVQASQTVGNALGEYQMQIEGELKVSGIPLIVESMGSLWENESADWHEAVIRATGERASGWMQRAPSFVHRDDLGVHANGMFNAPPETAQARRYTHLAGFWQRQSERVQG